MILKYLFILLILPLTSFSKVYHCSDINILGNYLQGNLNSSDAYHLTLEITSYACFKTNCQYKIKAEIRDQENKLISKKTDLIAKNHQKFDESSIATLTSKIFSNQKINLNLKLEYNQTILKIYYISQGEMELKSESECQITNF